MKCLSLQQVLGFSSDLDEISRQTIDRTPPTTSQYVFPTLITSLNNMRIMGERVIEMTHYQVTNYTSHSPTISLEDLGVIYNSHRTTRSNFPSRSDFHIPKILYKDLQDAVAMPRKRTLLLIPFIVAPRAR